jgi:hypothetical protein
MHTFCTSATMSKGLKPMSHLSFNVSVAYALAKVERSKRTCMPNARVKNLGKLHYIIAWSRHGNMNHRVCVICGKIRQWYCPTCQETVCMGHCFVIHHSSGVCKKKMSFILLWFCMLISCFVEWLSFGLQGCWSVYVWEGEQPLGGALFPNSRNHMH